MMESAVVSTLEQHPQPEQVQPYEEADDHCVRKCTSSTANRQHFPLTARRPAAAVFPFLSLN